MMGGEVGAQSVEGKGSEFWFTVHLKKQPDREQAERQKKPQAGGEDTAQSIATHHTARKTLPDFQDRKALILLAEDNITNQQMSLGILKKLGLRADTVADGREAVKALTDTSYDLVLMDCQMPVLDGYEACRRIRDPQSGVRNHNIPIIAMTADVMAGNREKCLEAGMNDFLAKPVRPRALAETLERWLPEEENKNKDRKKAETAPKKAKESRAVEPLVWDRDTMLEQLMGDEKLAAKIIEGFLADVPIQIQRLGEMLEKGDIDGATRQAHSIKGAAANVGGEALRALAFEMEKAGRTGDPKENDMKTLIVEEDFTSRLLLQEILKDFGPSHVAVNGREAVRIALDADEPYNLICLDIMMPEMDGQQALREIRALEEARDIISSRGAKIVMTTALGAPKDVFQAFKGLCDSYLTKPIQKARLLEELRRLKLIS